MKQTLKKMEKPPSAPIDIQYQYSVTCMPLALRTAFPIVDAFKVVSLFACDIEKTEPMLF